MEAISQFKRAETLSAWLRDGSAHVHLAGVGGIGMAGLAYHLARAGLRVSGCDRLPNHLFPWLEQAGVQLCAGHSPSHIAPDVQAVVHSTAVSMDQPELLAARTRGLPVWSRGQTLAALMAGYRAIAVSGTHGKTTTSALITHVLQAAGKSPSFAIGGEVPSLGGVAGIGSSRLFVAEADESDGTVALYAPAIAVVTNIGFDHIEHFASKEDVVACFTRFVEQASEAVVYCADDPAASALCNGGARAVSYGLDRSATIRGERVVYSGFSSAFDIHVDGQRAGKVHLPMPGRHNVQNALGAIAVGHAMGLSLDGSCEALATAELPRRRFEVVADEQGVLVISDYAHHPTEIGALVESAQRLGRKRLMAIFQPHRYTRTRALGPAFPQAFEGVDELVITPVYAASEAPVSGGSSEDLMAHFREAEGPSVTCAATLEDAWQRVKERLCEGDGLLVIGAGDVELIAGWARDALRAAVSRAH